MKLPLPAHTSWPHGLDVVQVAVHMCLPLEGDETKRNDLITAAKRQMVLDLLDSGASPEVAASEVDSTKTFPEVSRAFLSHPHDLYGPLGKLSRESAVDAQIAGWILIYLALTAEAHPELHGMNNAWRFAATRASTIGGLKSGGSTIRQLIWLKFKSVAHLWAAIVDWRINGEQSWYALGDPNALPYFLAVAEYYRRGANAKLLQDRPPRHVLPDPEAWVPSASLLPDLSPFKGRFGLQISADGLAGAKNKKVYAR